MAASAPPQNQTAAASPDASGVAPNASGAERAAREAAAQARVNSMLKSWRITKLLGCGPVATVYEAHRGAKDAVERGVLKILSPGAGSSPAAKSQFLRANYVANRFKHVRVLGVVEDGVDADKLPFIVRAAEGLEPLEAVVKRGPLPEADALRIGEQTLDALEMAHAHGLVHGAIKPSNILLTAKGSVRLVDFATPPGLSSREAGEDDALASLRAGPFTAPERLGPTPERASEQNDIYGVGAILFFALTGEFPRGAVLGALPLPTDAARPVREVNPAVGEHLAAVIDHSLAIDPVDRYETAYAMLGDIRRILAGRKPKLEDARAPVPSQSTRTLSSPQSSGSFPARVSPPASQTLAAALVAPASGRGKKRSEWRGNVLLVVAIALLVGVATYVLVRERVEEARASHGRGAPSSAQPTE